MTVSPAPSDAALRKVDNHVSTSLENNCDELDDIDLALWSDPAADVTRLVNREIERWGAVGAAAREQFVLPGCA